MPARDAVATIAAPVAKWQERLQAKHHAIYIDAHHAAVALRLQLLIDIQITVRLVALFECPRSGGCALAPRDLRVQLRGSRLIAATVSDQHHRAGTAHRFLQLTLKLLPHRHRRQLQLHRLSQLKQLLRRYPMRRL